MESLMAASRISPLFEKQDGSRVTFALQGFEYKCTLKRFFREHHSVRQQVVEPRISSGHLSRRLASASPYAGTASGRCPR
jgi:hypothetical protein